MRQSSGVNQPAAPKCEKNVTCDSISQSSGVQLSAAPKKVQKLMADVRDFGRWPLQRARSDDQALERERLLAVRISKMKGEGCLPAAVLEELRTLEAERKTSENQCSKASKVESLMADVRDFGRWPLQHARSDDQALERERLLALRISKMKGEGCLPAAALEELMALEAERKTSESQGLKASKVESLLAEVREFGRWPLQHEPSKDPKREAERLLAQRIAKMSAAACLPPAAIEELEALEAKHRCNQEALKCVRRAQESDEMMTRVTDLGRWPLLRRPLRSPKHEAEHQLARRVRSAIRVGALSKANQALLDEMHWMHRREQEAERLDTHQRRLLTRRKQARREALARVFRMRLLLGKLGRSKQRCTCHDFDCWAPMWKIDAALALKLRAGGFHFYDCVLAPYDCHRGRVWDIRRPQDHPLPTQTLISGASSAEQEGHADEDEESDQDSETSSGEATDEEEGSEQEHDFWDDQRDPMSDVMLARRRRRFRLHLAARSCAISAPSDGGVTQPSVHAECSDDGDLIRTRREIRMSFHSFELLGTCKHCDCDLDLGILRRCISRQERLGFSCLSIRHGGDVCNCPAYGMHGCGQSRFSMGWLAAMVPVDLLPGSDVDISPEDWAWLQKQCRVRSDWELGQQVSCNPREQVTACRMRVNYRGRIVRPRKPEALEFKLEEQAPFSRQDAAFGCRAWAYRARASPWRQRPEWELDNHDVHCRWMRVDAGILAQKPPCLFAELAEKAVSALGRWPTVEPHTSRTEKRLAACLHAVLAHPRFYGAECGTDALESWLKIKGIWQHCLRKDQSLGAAAVTPCCMSEDPADGHIQCLLRNIGLSTPPVDARSIFRHTPAQNMVRAIHRFHLVRRSPLFHGMEIGQTCMHNDDKLYEWILENRRGHDNDGGSVWGPEGRLFMFQLHVDTYNHRGMSAEDPQALRWRPEKLLVDFGPIATASDWVDACCSLEAAERDWLERYAAWHRRARGTPMRGQEIREEHCTFGPDSELWETIGMPIRFDHCWHQECPEHVTSVGSHHTGNEMLSRTRISWLHNSLYTRRVLFRPGGKRAMEPNASALKPFKIEWPLHPGLDSLQWIGGTYAAHPHLFPREQVSATWIRKHLLPLSIAPPRRFQQLLDFSSKRWDCHTLSLIGHEGFAKKRYPGIAAIEKPLPTGHDITKSWQRKFDWFTVAPRLHVPDEQVAAWLGKELSQTGSRAHITQELLVQKPGGTKVVPATTAFMNQAYVERLQRYMHTGCLDVWTSASSLSARNDNSHSPASHCR